VYEISIRITAQTGPRTSAMGKSRVISREDIFRQV